MNEGDLYADREQTQVKHFILEHYLERFAHIVGSAWDAITYVDCFAGPWNARSDQLEDSSFALALAQLKAARANLADFKMARGRPPLELRCFFLEKDAAAYAKLNDFARGQLDAEIATRNATLEQSIDDIIAFVARRQNDAFPFIFIDPTGWAGPRLDVIAPLLKLRPGEVLVNFMTGHILRFVESPNAAHRQSFDRLFGPIDYRTRIAGLTGREREDELVRCYCDAIRLTGGYKYVCAAIVIHPQIDRTHFHLLYATRNPTGVKEFKQIEKKAMEFMKKARGDAQKRKRVDDTAQGELFDADAMHSTQHYDALRTRHLTAAKADMEQRLQTHGTVEYDDAWDAALFHPLVWESDLKDWVANWRKDGQLKVNGLKRGERVPKRGAGHQLVWLR